MSVRVRAEISAKHPHNTTGHAIVRGYDFRNEADANKFMTDMSALDVQVNEIPPLKYHDVMEAVADFWRAAAGVK